MIPPLRPTLRRLATLVVVAVLLVVLWFSYRLLSSNETHGPAINFVQNRGGDPSASLPRTPLNPIKAQTKTAPAASRQDIIDGILAVYRKTQLSRELDLAQQRYGTDYWKPDHNGAELAALRERRDALLRDLSDEGNRAIASYFPNQAVEPVTLRPLFDDDHPAPNITYLSPDSRERFEAALLRQPELDRQKADEIARETLSAEELEWYHRWNDRNAAALRNELVGFDANEREFNALLQQNRVAGETGESYGSGFALEGQIGHDRLMQLETLRSPAMHTAIQDLNHAGLPLDSAAWLASTRQRAIADIQQIWQNATLSDAAKAQQVSAVQRQYGQQIDARLGRRGSTLEEIGRAP